MFGGEDLEQVQLWFQALHQAYPDYFHKFIPVTGQLEDFAPATPMALVMQQNTFLQHTRDKLLPILGLLDINTPVNLESRATRKLCKYFYAQPKFCPDNRLYQLEHSMLCKGSAHVIYNHMMKAKALGVMRELQLQARGQVNAEFSARTMAPSGETHRPSAQAAYLASLDALVGTAGPDSVDTGNPVQPRHWTAPPRRHQVQLSYAGAVGTTQYVWEQQPVPWGNTRPKPQGAPEEQDSTLGEVDGPSAESMASLVSVSTVTMTNPVMAAIQADVAAIMEENRRLKDTDDGQAIHFCEMLSAQSASNSQVQALAAQVADLLDKVAVALQQKEVSSQEAASTDIQLQIASQMAMMRQDMKSQHNVFQQTMQHQIQASMHQLHQQLAWSPMAHMAAPLYGTPSPLCFHQRQAPTSLFQPHPGPPLPSPPRYPAQHVGVVRYHALDSPLQGAPPAAKKACVGGEAGWSLSPSDKSYYPLDDGRSPWSCRDLNPTLRSSTQSNTPHPNTNPV